MPGTLTAGDRGHARQGHGDARLLRACQALAEEDVGEQDGDDRIQRPEHRDDVAVRQLATVRHIRTVIWSTSAEPCARA